MPSPFQRRTNFDPVKLKDLARSIINDGLIHPILVRPVGEGFELIAGERRFRAVRDYTDVEAIEAKVVEADDIGAQNLSATENRLREDLPIFETIEETVAIVDSQLRGDDEYDAMGATPIDRVKTLLAKLDAVRRSELGGYQVANAAKMTSRNFAGSVNQIFENLPKPDVSRETVALAAKVKVLLMCRLGIPIDVIASILKIDWKTAKKYSQDCALLRIIRNALGT